MGYAMRTASSIPPIPRPVRRYRFCCFGLIQSGTMKRWMITGMLFLPVLSLCAQKMTTTHASFYHWSGGVCCRTGTSYTFGFRITGDTSVLQPDTLYVDGHIFPLENKGMLHSDRKNRYEYTISLRYERDERVAPPDTIPGSEQDVPYPAFSGKALLTYRIAGKRKTLVVKNMKQEASVHYP